MSPKLLASYINAKYIVVINGDDIRIRVGDFSPEIDEVLRRKKAQYAYLITPENPFSISLSSEENKLRHGRFLAKLLEYNYFYLEGFGTDEDELWGREKSYLIVCNNEQRMHVLASNFGQNALLKLSFKKKVELMVLEAMIYKKA